MYPFWKSSSHPQQASSSSRSSGTKVPTQARKVNDSLFELHKPPGTTQMQLLFFHGLQLEDSSDLQFSTWSCGDGSCWPQTWLVKKFPGAHVLTVSYNGSIEKGSQGVLDMHLVGENLTSDLLQDDIWHTPDCPIILVGHSFGGLVIKQLYRQAHDKLHSSREGFEKAKLEKFLGNIKGIFYYATPHHGSKLVGEMAGTLEVNPLLKYFQTLSTEAARLNSKFDEIREKYGKLDVFGLAEGLKTKLRDFKDDMLVSEASARDGSLYTVSGADHFSICQPENETSASFLKLKIFIDNVAREAEVEANNRKEAKAREDNRFDNRQALPESIVGIEVPVQAVIAKLDKAATVGIVRMGGLGKTSLAKALFNKLGAAFEYSCFVLEVKKIEGDMNKAKEKIWKLMHRQGKKVGMEVDWSLLKGKRLFLVLDDISSDRDLATLSSIVQDTSPESRFIVTSRDHQLVGRLDDVFDVSLLDESTARQLFVRHAFAKQEEPRELQSFVDRIVRRCGGLPLSLEVVGKSLYRRGYQEDWEQSEHALHKADDLTELNEKLWKILRVSYDRLTEKEKKVFLDAATFFSGNTNWTLRDAKAAWRVVYVTKSEGLLWQTLVNLSLVYNVAEDETIKVHEQLQSLGRKIASEQRQDLEGFAGLHSLQQTRGFDGKAISSLRLITEYADPREHIASSALQRLGDVRYMDVVDKFLRIGIDGVEGCESVPTQLTLLACNIPQLSRILLHSTLCKSLVGLKLWDMKEWDVENLRVLKETRPFRYLSFRCSKLSGTAPIGRVLHDIGRFSQLEVLGLKSFPCQSLPVTFGQLKKLRHLELVEFDNLCTLPESFGQLEALKYLTFSGCGKLHTLPNSFGNLSSLTRLEFHDCPELHTLPNSFGNLSSLTRLEFHDCSELHTLPNSFGNLSSLTHLEFYGRRTLHTLPNSFGNLSSLTRLEFHGCPELHTLPNSFGNLSSLTHLEFRHCSELHTLPNSFGNLSSLTYLKFLQCEKLHTLPNSFGNLSSLTRLEFHYCSEFHTLPNSFGNLSSLTRLEFHDCSELHTLPNSFGNLSSLTHLEFYGRRTLHTLPNSFGNLSSLAYLKFIQCEKLHTLPDSFGNLSSLTHLEFDDCSELHTLPNSFGNLSSLTHLKFDACRTLHILPNSFGNLSSLTYLEFRFCLLHTLPNSFGNLSSLTYLKFFYCQELHTLPDSFGNLSSLTHLEFCGCSALHTLPNSFENLSSLIHLEVRRCRTLHTLPNSFGNLSSLTRLEFRDCSEMHTLPNSFGNLCSLTYLKFFSCEKLHTLPNSFGSLSSLIHLEFHGCRMLHTLPNSFENLSSLTHLEFHDCSELHTLPNSFENLYSLTRLEFHDCSELHTLPNSFGNLSSLIHLGFYGCRTLHTLPNSFGNLSSLTHLVFWTCVKLHTLPNSFGNLSSLTYLKFLQCEKLHTLPNSFGNLSSLTHLEFHYCSELHTLPNSFRNLCSLTYLKFFSCEKLHTLPNSFGNLSSLTVKMV